MTSISASTLKALREDAKSDNFVHLKERAVSRDGKTGPVPDSISIRSTSNLLDAKPCFAAALLAAWGNPTHVEVKESRSTPGLFRLVPKTEEERGAGVYKIDQAQTWRQGTITLTWKLLGRVPPENGRCIVPFAFLGDEDNSAVFDLRSLRAV